MKRRPTKRAPAFGVGGRNVIPLQSSLFAEVPSATFGGR